MRLKRAARKGQKALALRLPSPLAAVLDPGVKVDQAYKAVRREKRGSGRGRFLEELQPVVLTRKTLQQEWYFIILPIILPSKNLFAH